MNFIKIKTILFISFLTLPLFAEEGLTIVAVGDAEAEKDRMVFVAANVPSNADPAMKASINEVQALLQNDFAFYRNSFEVIKPGGYETDCAKRNYSKLKAKNLRYCVVANYEKNSATVFTLEAILVDVRAEKDIESIRVTIPVKSPRENAHEAADVLYQKIFGKTSIFRSKILFVSDYPSRGKGDIKELYIMDFDGKNRTQLTRHGGTVISPALSFDGNQVLYSLIKNGRSKKRNVNLRIMDIRTRKSRLLSSRSGINSGAVFMPDGKHIALTMSHGGNAEIYALNIKTKKTRRITKHFAPDVDPSINVSGTKIAFLSGRSGTGSPMIYLGDPRGLEKSVKRISYVGKFNATPRFNPDGSQIAFSSWLDNRFDIFRVDENGDNLHRLTKDFGSNEDPTYSNDGQFIAFSSQRVLSRKKAVQNIYIMTSEGEILGKVTENFGNCTTPRWSKY